MTTFAAWRSFARAFLRRREMERDMESELQFHIEARADHLVTLGLDHAAATRQARREFGDPLRWKEQGREARGLRLIDEARADVRYAVRWLRRSPTFAAAVVFSTLARTLPLSRDHLKVGFPDALGSWISTR